MKNEDKWAIAMLIVIFVAVLFIRWAVLSYAPCSIFTVADAPVRCLHE